MDFFDVVAARRSVRSFSDGPVPDASIARCLEAARLAPSASNAQPWRFLVARDPARRAALAEAGYRQTVLREAPVMTVLFADRSRHKQRLRRARELADLGAFDAATTASVREGYVAREAARAEAPGGLAADRERVDAELKANAMLAGEHYALAAEALGLGCCWVGLFDAEKVVAACGDVPEGCFPVALLPTGVAAPSQRNLAARPRHPLDEIAWRETAGTPWA